MKPAEEKSRPAHSAHSATPPLRSPCEGSKVSEILAEKINYLFRNYRSLNLWAVEKILSATLGLINPSKVYLLNFYSCVLDFRLYDLFFER